MDRRRPHRLRRWHRHIGVGLTAFVILVALTGVLLNHTEDLELDARTVPGAIAGWYYDGDLDGVTGFETPAGVLFLVGTDVYLGQRVVTTCFDGLRSAAPIGVAGTGMGPMIAALCGNELLLVDNDGVLVERLGPVHGVPTQIDALGSDDGGLLLQRGDRAVLFDPFELSIVPVGAGGNWLQPTPVPGDLAGKLLVATVSWEKVILDLHTGRILGVGGAWLADFVALLFVVMAVTGLVLARRPRHRRIRRRRRRRHHAHSQE